MECRTYWIPSPGCRRRARRKSRQWKQSPQLKKLADIIRENGGASFQFCYQCGICDVVCPWNRVRRFSMRKIVRQATFGLTEIEQEDIWRCTTCGTCPQRCPRGVNQIQAGVSLRRIATEYGVFPDSVTPVSPSAAASWLKATPSIWNGQSGRIGRKVCR